MSRGAPAAPGCPERRGAWGAPGAPHVLRHPRPPARGRGRSAPRARPRQGRPPGARRGRSRARTGSADGSDTRPAARWATARFPGSRRDPRAIGVTCEQHLRVGMPRALDDVGGGARLDRLARVHHHHLVAELRHHAEVVGDEEHRHAEVAREVAEQSQDLQLRGHVERGRRLVGDHELRPAGERAGDQEALALAAAELVRVALERGLRIGDLHRAQELEQARAMRVAAAGAAVPAQDLEELGADAEGRVEREVGVLRDEADLLAPDAPA